VYQEYLSGSKNAKYENLFINPTIQMVCHDLKGIQANRFHHRTKVLVSFNVNKEGNLFLYQVEINNQVVDTPRLVSNLKSSAFKEWL
jgi:hypothetical protein